MPPIVQRLRRIPAWCRQGRRDLEAAHLRRLTPLYRAKQRIVKNVWITACLCMLLNPIAPVVAIIGLFTSFLSFAILDETPGY